MGAESQLGRHIRFGVFELDTATGELRKHGVRLRLQDQPLKLLLCLLETPGEVCPREVLIRRIWPEGTFVDYDRGLNSAATRLRQVIGDSRTPHAMSRQLAERDTALSRPSSGRQYRKSVRRLAT